MKLSKSKIHWEPRIDLKELRSKNLQLARCWRQWRKHVYSTYHPFVESQLNYHQNNQFKIIITCKNINIHLENHFSLKEKTIKQTPNNFTIIKSITIIFKFMPELRSTKYNNKSSFVCLTTKKETSLLFFMKHSISQLKKTLPIFLCSHTH